ncbi:hypothetical protein NDU88_005543 [Pleurodeles waltl]|uniref:Uncharacterized protein n=1 Tax=Pleurodeles waltl TaxID=8319 RepID=A0AAV7MD90_PLEWA|nr:hypothetical protein NDU88_005543 [Pleurodeles waltl]
MSAQDHQQPPCQRQHFVKGGEAKIDGTLDTKGRHRWKRGPAAGCRQLTWVKAHDAALRGAAYPTPKSASSALQDRPQISAGVTVGQRPYVLRAFCHTNIKAEVSHPEEMGGSLGDVTAGRHHGLRPETAARGTTDAGLGPVEQPVHGA